MNDAFRHLLSPIDIGPFELKNRVLSTGHTNGLQSRWAHRRPGDCLPRSQGPGRRRAERYWLHRGASLRGRPADAPPGELRRLGAPRVPQAGRGDARARRPDADPAHPSGIRIRLAPHGPRHLGAVPADGRVRARAPARHDQSPRSRRSSTPSPRRARRVRLGGLDGIELQAFAASLAIQFLSPYTNKRSDQWGAR